VESTQKLGYGRLQRLLSCERVLGVRSESLEYEGTDWDVGVVLMECESDFDLA
jgi:hypothetical protein